MSKAKKVTLTAYVDRDTDTSIYPMPNGGFGVCYYETAGSKGFIDYAKMAASISLGGPSTLEQALRVYPNCAKVAYTYYEYDEQES